MGKMKKVKVMKSKRNNPLDKQILESELPKQSTRVKVRNRRDADEEFVDNKLSKKILEQAREQQEELEEEYEYSTASKLSSELEGVSIRCEASDEFSETDDEDHSVKHPAYVSDIQVSEDDKKALEMFMSKDSSETASLGKVIKEKLTERQTELQSQFSDVGSLKLPKNIENLIPKFRDCAYLLSRYRSGKVPKFFKIIPRLQNWEQVLHLTEPDNWSSAAVYQATRMFASNLKENMAQRFFNLVLLPRLRDDIVQCKTLNFHLYQSLRKSLFKPGGFFKGIVLPLLESGTCTLREATIIGSVIAKYSIPVLHSSATIMRIAEMDYNGGANSIFMRVLLEKKYALPFRVLDAVVAHFLRFALDQKELPLLWHQCLLTFAQHYKNDISAEQQEHLLNLLEVHSHPHVTPEIRRELESGKCRYTNTMECESKPAS